MMSFEVWYIKGATFGKGEVPQNIIEFFHLEMDYSSVFCACAKKTCNSKS